jgi:hypothetical protein
MSTTHKPLFQDFVRANLGIGWVIAAALGIGLLAGSLGSMMTIPSQVFNFNRQLENAGLYDFYYQQYSKDPRFSNTELLTPEERDKVERTTAILMKDAPGMPVTLFMFIVGLGALLIFFFKLASALYGQVATLSEKVEELSAQLSPSSEPSSPSED